MITKQLKCLCRVGWMFLLVGPSQTLGAITKAKFSPPDAAAPVVGERGLDGTVRSQLQCAVSCLDGCIGYRYDRATRSCLLILLNTGSGKSISTSGTVVLQAKRCSSPWSGPGEAPSHFLDLDTSDCLRLMNGAAVGPGKVAQGIVTDRARKQWADLGVLYPAVCMVRPETCTSGATLSVWIKVDNCQEGDGILSAVTSTSFGFQLRCTGTSADHIMVGFWLGEGDITLNAAKPTGWFHCVVVLLPSLLDVVVYEDGEQVVRGSAGPKKYADVAAPGRLQIARRLTDADASRRRTSGLTVDELAFWNRNLSAMEIRELYRFYTPPNA